MPQVHLFIIPKQVQQTKQRLITLKRIGPSHISRCADYLRMLIYDFIALPQCNGLMVFQYVTNLMKIKVGLPYEGEQLLFSLNWSHIGIP